MAAWYASQDKTLYDALQDCYAKYGHYGESTINLVMPGLDGMRDMAAIMEQLHKAPLTEVAGTAVVAQKDYQAGTVTDPATGAVTPMELKDSNVVAYNLARRHHLHHPPFRHRTEDQGIRACTRLEPGGM